MGNEQSLSTTPPTQTLLSRTLTAFFAHGRAVYFAEQASLAPFERTPQFVENYFRRQLADEFISDAAKNQPAAPAPILVRLILRWTNAVGLYKHSGVGSGWKCVLKGLYKLRSEGPITLEKWAEFAYYVGQASCRQILTYETDERIWRLRDLIFGGAVNESVLVLVGMDRDPEARALIGEALSRGESDRAFKVSLWQVGEGRIGRFTVLRETDMDYIVQFGLSYGRHGDGILRFWTEGLKAIAGTRNNLATLLPELSIPSTDLVTAPSYADREKCRQLLQALRRKLRGKGGPFFEVIMLLFETATSLKRQTNGLRVSDLWSIAFAVGLLQNLDCRFSRAPGIAPDGQPATLYTLTSRQLVIPQNSEAVQLLLAVLKAFNREWRSWGLFNSACMQADAPEIASIWIGE